MLVVIVDIVDYSLRNGSILCTFLHGKYNMLQVRNALEKKLPILFSNLHSLSRYILFIRCTFTSNTNVFSQLSNYYSCERCIIQVNFLCLKKNVTAEKYVSIFNS